MVTSALGVVGDPGLLEGKKTSNEEWESKTDPGARVARMKDGRTRSAYKVEHRMDMETGAILVIPEEAKLPTFRIYWALAVA